MSMFALLLGCLVPNQVQQLSELLDFTEQERLTLLEKEAALQQELEQVGVVPPSGVWWGNWLHGEPKQDRINISNHVLQSEHCMHAELLLQGTSPAHARVSRAHCNKLLLVTAAAACQSHRC